MRLELQDNGRFLQCLAASMATTVGTTMLPSETSAADASQPQISDSFRSFLISRSGAPGDTQWLPKVRAIISTVEEGASDSSFVSEFGSQGKSLYLAVQKYLQDERRLLETHAPKESFAAAMAQLARVASRAFVWTGRVLRVTGQEKVAIVRAVRKDIYNSFPISSWRLSKGQQWLAECLQPLEHVTRVGCVSNCSRDLDTPGHQIRFHVWNEDYTGENSDKRRYITAIKFGDKTQVVAERIRDYVEMELQFVEGLIRFDELSVCYRELLFLVEQTLSVSSRDRQHGNRKPAVDPSSLRRLVFDRVTMNSSLDVRWWFESLVHNPSCYIRSRVRLADYAGSAHFPELLRAIEHYRRLEASQAALPEAQVDLDGLVTALQAAADLCWRVDKWVEYQEYLVRPANNLTDDVAALRRHILGESCHFRDRSVFWFSQFLNDLPPLSRVGDVQLRRDSALLTLYLPPIQLSYSRGSTTRSLGQRKIGDDFADVAHALRDYLQWEIEVLAETAPLETLCAKRDAVLYAYKKSTRVDVGRQDEEMEVYDDNGALDLTVRR